MNTEEKELLGFVRDYLYAFYILFVADNYEGTQNAEHIKKLSIILQNVIQNPNFKKRISIAMPPQHSKSSLATIALSVWLICNNPNRRILIINAEKELSSSFGIEIRNLFYTVGPLFGIKTSKVKSSSTHLKFEKNGKLCKGEIRLTGAAGSISGHPADIVIVDDPYKGLDLEFTPTALNKKWSWYTSLVEQRLRTNGILILLHTRWHSEDLQGRIKMDEYQRSKYEFVELPAIDEQGNPLWPEYYPLEFYEDKRRTMSARKFQAIYQQKPLDLTSDFFYIDKIIWEDQGIGDKHYLSHCRSWDLAYTKVNDVFDDKYDYTAGLKCYKINENHYLFTDFVYGQFGQDNIRRIQQTAKIDGVSTPILLETGTYGGAAEELYNEWKTNYLQGYPTEQSNPWGSKADRATALRYAVYDGDIHVHINDKNIREEFIEQFRAFPNGKHDDIIDACAYAYNYLKDFGDPADIYGTGATEY